MVTVFPGNASFSCCCVAVWGVLSVLCVCVCVCVWRKSEFWCLSVGGCLVLLVYF